MKIRLKSNGDILGYGYDNNYEKKADQKKTLQNILEFIRPQFFVISERAHLTGKPKKNILSISYTGFMVTQRYHDENQILRNNDFSTINN